MRKIWLPIGALLLAAVLLLGAYNLTLGLRQEIQEKELQAKMSVLLPGSKTFTAEEYTGEDQTIAYV